MKKIKSEIKNLIRDAYQTTITLLKIMIPVSIIVKIISHYGVIEYIGNILQPIMNIVGLPGEFGLVWAATIITNIYGGLIVIFTLSINNSYSVAQITVLGTMMLIAHTFPIELQIAKRAGARIWFMFLLRFLGAFILGWIMNFIFTFFKLYSTPSKILWSPGIINPSLLEWVINECRNYLMIFLQTSIFHWILMQLQVNLTLMHISIQITKRKRRFLSH